MTMHVVLGDGEMTRKELTETLQDIWKADEENGQTFWFLLQGKSEPTDTDKALVKWLETNEIYYEVVTDDADAMDAIYAQPQEKHVAKQLSRKIVNLLGSKPEEGEEAELLALFFSDDSSAEEDRWLNTVCQDVFDAKYTVRALNDGLLEVDLSEAPETAAAETAATPAKATKAVAKKGGAAPRRDTEVSEEGATAASSATYSRDQLEEMELPAIKEIAGNLGIELPPRTRMSTYIDAILGEGGAPAAEVTPIAASNGQIDTEAIADAIIRNIITRLETALA